MATTEKLRTAVEDLLHFWDLGNRPVEPRHIEAIRSALASFTSTNRCKSCDGTGSYLDADDQVHTCPACRVSEPSELAKRIAEDLKEFSESWGGLMSIERATAIAEKHIAPLEADSSKLKRILEAANVLVEVDRLEADNAALRQQVRDLSFTSALQQGFLKGAAKQRDDAKSFLSYAMTVRDSNTDEWMDGFVQRATAVAKVLGETGEFVRDKDMIRWVEAEKQAAPSGA